MVCKENFKIQKKKVLALKSFHPYRLDLRPYEDIQKRRWAEQVVASSRFEFRVKISVNHLNIV